MARRWWFDRLVPPQKRESYIRTIVAGSFYKFSDIRGDTAFADIKTQIDTMRALAQDSQISTALSYYATDATTTDPNGRIIWATAISDKYSQVAEIINTLFNNQMIILLC